jgi:hypothetical protein
MEAGSFRYCKGDFVCEMPGHRAMPLQSDLSRYYLHHPHELRAQEPPIERFIQATIEPMETMPCFSWIQRSRTAVKADFLPLPFSWTAA